MVQTQSICVLGCGHHGSGDWDRRGCIELVPHGGGRRVEFEKLLRVGTWNKAYLGQIIKWSSEQMDSYFSNPVKTI